MDSSSCFGPQNAAAVVLQFLRHLLNAFLHAHQRNSHKFKRLFYKHFDQPNSLSHFPLKRKYSFSCFPWFSSQETHDTFLSILERHPPSNTPPYSSQTHLFFLLVNSPPSNHSLRSTTKPYQPHSAWLFSQNKPFAPLPFFALPFLLLYTALPISLSFLLSAAPLSTFYPHSLTHPTHSKEKLALQLLAISVRISLEFRLSHLS